MRLPESSGDPAHRAPAHQTAMRWAGDVLLALLAWASAVPVLFQATNGAGDYPVKLVVLALITAPLRVRRRRPGPVFAWTLLSSVAAVSWDGHLVSGLGLLIALYT